MRINYEQALECIRIVLERHVAKHGEAPPFLVVVGGTALSAHGIRALSTDIHYYSPVVDDELVFTVESEMKQTYGRDFKIDATPAENLWGPILFRDIADSQEHEKLTVGGIMVPILKLSIEDLAMVKLVAGRPKDREDLPLIARRTTAEALTDRFNKVVKWHGDRNAVIAFADSFVDFVSEKFDKDAATVIETLSVPEYVKKMLRETRDIGTDHNGYK
ncbi:hypothetical protein G6L37_00815 [Agrobacterium rubi]|nr:hypothetical protein [Agrobacterium rubi]NTF23932.1 hypothetical protein [Agrobacterium rubi]